MAEKKGTKKGPRDRGRGVLKSENRKLETAPAEISIPLPLPPRRLSPNARGGWQARVRHTKSYRALAALMTGAAGGANLHWSEAVAQATFYWPDRRRRDIRNAEHALKAAYDGIVDAGLLVDDRAEVLRHAETRFEVDRKNPRVEIVVRRKGPRGPGAEGPRKTRTAAPLIPGSLLPEP